MAYLIKIQCDPYNAKWHYRGEAVLKYDGATPTAWVHHDELYNSRKQVQNELNSLADRELDNGQNRYVNDYVLNEEIEEFGPDYNTDWYEGEGYYSCYGNRRLTDPEMTYFSHDTLTFTIMSVDVTMVTE